MSRDFSRGALAVLALALATSPARADDLVNAAKKAEAAKQSLEKKVSAKVEHLSEAADDAKQRAKQAADGAKQRSKEKASKLQEQAEKMKGDATSYANGVKDSLHERADKLSDDAKGMYEHVQSWLSGKVQSVRAAIRDSLQGAANAIDGKRSDALDDVRNEQWQKLRERYGLPDQAPTLELSEELREHEQRIAQLRRVRELAEDADDQASVVRSDHLTEREVARHHRRLKRLVEASGEQLSYRTDEP